MIFHGMDYCEHWMKIVRNTSEQKKCTIHAHGFICVLKYKNRMIEGYRSGLKVDVRPHMINIGFIVLNLLALLNYGFVRCDCRGVNRLVRGCRSASGRLR